MRKVLLFLSGLAGLVLSGAASDIEVINAGVPGDNTDQMLTRFDADVTAKKPDLVVLLAGTNDMLNSYNLIAPDRYRKNLDEMISKAQESGASVILCEIPNAYQPYMEKRHKAGFFQEQSAAVRIARTNRALKTLAARRKVPLVLTTFALGGASASGNSFFRNTANSGAEDGVHPTPAGYRRLAQAVAEVIRTNHPQARRIVCMGDSITRGVHVKPEEGYPAQLAGLLKIPAVAEGRITNRGNGEGIGGILLSDGVNFTRSGADGRYRLPVRNPNGFVMVHLPSEYRAEQWHRKLAAGAESYDFALRKVEVRRGVRFLQVADTETVTFEWIPLLKRMAKHYGADFLVHTGDICRFPAIRLHAEKLNSEAFGMPVYYTVGNHDLVPDNPDGSNYPDVLGPYWYSFEMGGILFVAAPIHYGEIAMPYRMTEFADYLEKLLKEFPADQPKVILAHELLDHGDAPSFTTSAGTKIDLANHRVKGWFYGHWHKNIVKKHLRGLTSYSTANVNHGGIGHYPSSARLSEITADGNIDSRLIWTPAERLLTLTAPSAEQSVRDAEGRLVVSAIAYDAGAPVERMTGSIDFGSGATAVAMKQCSSWSWDGRAEIPAGAVQGTLRLECRFADGHTETRETRFLTASLPPPATAPKGVFGNLQGNAAHCPPRYPALKQPLRMQWLTSLPGENRMTTPVIADGRVFVATIDDGNAEQGGIWALDAGNGSVLWRARTGYSIANSIAYGDGLVFAGDSRGNVFACDGKDGKMRWSHTPVTTGLPPMISGGVFADGVFYSGIRNELRAYEGGSGRVLWHASDWRRGEATPATLTVADGKLFAVAFWYGIRCYDIRDGKVLWTATGGEFAGEAATPVWANGELYVKGEKKVHVLDAATGKVLRSSQTYAQARSAAPVLVTDSLVIAGTASDGLVALDRATLAERWRFKPGLPLIDTTPYVHGMAQQDAAPLSFGEELLVPSLDGSLYLLREKDGSVVSRIASGAPFGASVATADGWIFCADFAGRVMAFRIIRLPD